jgi:hypothetical protein
MTEDRAKTESGIRRAGPRFKRARWVTALTLVALVGAFALYRLPIFAPSTSPRPAAIEDTRARTAAEDGPGRTAIEETAPPAATGKARPRIYRHAGFSGEHASTDARGIANWVVDSGDNRGRPFIILDKTAAKLFVFNPAGHLIGASAALLGSARGDHLVPGVGNKKLSEITPAERTTPAGRFVAEPGENLKGEGIVWVDYDAGLSIHAVRANNPRESRLKRLASPTPADNRISYGCINVPVNFFRTVVAPTFRRTRGIAYVLPETRPAQVVFNSYEVPAGAPASSAAVAVSLRDR